MAGEGVPLRPARSAPRGEPSPHHLAGQAQLVEPAGVVAGDPGREDLCLPLRRRRLDPGQLFERRQQSGPSLDAAVRRRMLPVRQEADEVGDRHRLHQAAAPAAAGAVQAHEEVAGAPAPVGQLDGRPLGLEAGQRRARPALGQRRTQWQPGGQRRVGHQLVRGDRPGELEVAGHAGGGRIVVGRQRPRLDPALGGHPAPGELARPAGGGQRLVPPGPCRDGPGRHEREQEVVELVGVAGPRADLVEHRGDRVGMQRRQLGRRHREAVGSELAETAAQREGTGAPLLEGGVVEIGERAAAQDGVREG